MAKAVAGVGCTVLALPLLAAMIIAALLRGLMPSESVSAAPSQQALADVPPSMLALYQRAAPECLGLSWTILAAIGNDQRPTGPDRASRSHRPDRPAPCSTSIKQPVVGDGRSRPVPGRGRNRHLRPR